jgi:putative ABC transport system permease protein
VSTSGEGTSSLASEIKFNMWREENRVFENVSGYYSGAVNLTDLGEPRRANAMFVTADYFRLFGLPMARGRSFTAGEERPKGGHAVILGNELWKSAFGGDPLIIGKTIALDGKAYEVAGIMAADIETETAVPPDVWLPFPIDPNSSFQAHYFQAVGRLRPGVTLETANAQLQITTRKFQREFPNTLSTSRGDRFSVVRMRDVLVTDVRASLLILWGAVGFVLLIACANVANLLLVRAAARKGEMAIRVALGASRGRIIRQLLSESVMLSAAGGVAGLLLGTAAIRALLVLNPVAIPRLGVNGANVALDWRVLAFTAIITLLTGLLFGLLPAIDASRSDLNRTLKAQRSTSSAHSLLVIGEMSLALLLLIGAALLIRTLVALHSVDPGFDPRNVVTTQTTLNPRSAKTAGVDPIVRDVVRRLRVLPGVESVGFTQLLPLSGAFDSLPIVVAGRPLHGPSHGSSRWVVVSPDYFETLKIPLLRGRLFTEADRAGSSGVAIINRAMARRFWPAGDPLNARIVIGPGLGPNFDEPARHIVGILADVHEDALAEPPQPAVFVPGAQLSDARTAGRPVSWVIRTRGPSQSLNAAIRNELRTATGEPVPPLRSMEEIVVHSTARQNFEMLLMSIFGGSALLLAAIGIYGLMAYRVERRTQEIGIRMALGARPEDVRNMMVLQGMRLAFSGAAIGITAAMGLTRFLASFLFGVKTVDPLVFAVTPILLGAVALLAIWIPAQRATRIDPIRALRCE